MPYLRMNMMIDIVDGQLGRRETKLDPFSTPLHEYAKGAKEDLFIIEDDSDDDEAARDMNIALDWSQDSVEEQKVLLNSFKDAMSR